ncbi:hypothetical protein [Nostoc sp. NIES-3756]|uniref:hypothetical protein n=1 Tax=Nostoc sp. NIES-3756 TaxID=1751286 RepID=UPI0011DF820B|nr:hypothetical protein [Nostoc sp. NIES-3756]
MGSSPIARFLQKLYLKGILRIYPQNHHPMRWATQSGTAIAFRAVPEAIAFSVMALVVSVKMCDRLDPSYLQMCLERGKLNIL